MEGWKCKDLLKNLNLCLKHECKSYEFGLMQGLVVSFHFCKNYTLNCDILALHVEMLGSQL